LLFDYAPGRRAAAGAVIAGDFERSGTILREENKGLEACF
jgi:hypothetical protein